MLRKVILLSGLLFLFGCATIPSQPAVLPQENYGTVIQETSEQIRKLMRKNDVVGLSIALVDDQRIVWAEGFGYADKGKKIPATAETVYRVGSISKLFTSTAVMQLEEKGKLNIDSAFVRYVPEFSIRSRFQDAPSITPRTMLTHHSGIPGDILKGFITRNASHYSTVIDDLKSEYVAYPINFVFAYSNVAMSLLGYMVEKVSGEDFVQYIEGQIFEPIGMNHSSFGMPPHIEKLYSKSYREGKEYEDPDIREVPAGKMVSNVLDLSDFISMVFAEGTADGNQIIRPETLDEMLTVQNADVELDLDIEWGLGWSLTRGAGLGYAGKVASHMGSTVVFHSLLITLPEQKLGIVVLTNSERGRTVADQVAPKILKRALELRGIKAPKVSDPPKLVLENEGDLSQYEGIYSFPFGSTEVESQKGRLRARIDKIKIDLIPNDRDTYTPQLRLFGLFHKTIFDQEVEFLEMGGMSLISVTSDGLNRILAQKVEETPIPDSWRRREGEYENINKGEDIIFVEDPSLVVEDGLLIFEGEIMDDRIRGILQPIDDNEAIMIGLGRHMRETFRVVKDENGDELLLYSGYLMKKR
tara:strand:- start:2164 stop:3918 length:1755 start_codon:yes stop_codon:yes gene_type:complete